LASIQDGLDRANEKAIAKPQNVQQFAVLPKEFSMAGGELGPTLKLKRFFVVEKYADVIEKMYQKTIKCRG
jgi:long-chain-fatty-acid--CoA ligase ACSBG